MDEPVQVLEYDGKKNDVIFSCKHHEEVEDGRIIIL